MKYKYIIWDWNGTLIDDVNLSVDIFNKMCSAYGLDTIGVDDYRRDFKFPVIKFYEEHGYDFSKLDFAKVGHYYISAYNRRRFKCSLHVGAEETMRSLAESGCVQSVLSAYEQNNLLKTVMRFGIDKYLDEIFGLDNIMATSKIELGKRLLETLGADPKRVVMIGDTAHDKATADAMGVDCALLTIGHNDAASLRNLGVPLFDSHSDLLRFLKKSK